MRETKSRAGFRYVAFSLALAVSAWALRAAHGEIGREVGLDHHLTETETYDLSLPELITHGRNVFTAVWTSQEGEGRPFTKGTGAELSDPSSPLVGARGTNRLSGPDANACSGCHAQPRAGGSGDRVANVFVLGQRFDFVTFDASDAVPTRGMTDERGIPVRLETFANSRGTIGMFGSGFIEMLARQMSTELRGQRDELAPGGAVALQTKGIAFGTLRRTPAGDWDTSGVRGLPRPSLATTGPADPPSLVVRPFSQAGATVSLREFSDSAFNQHHGMQSEERFGAGTDEDGDGFRAELTVGDITAVALFQAQLAVPGRIVPRDPVVEDAVRLGERTFQRIGCTGCHVPSLPLTDQGWIFTEPGPFNPPGTLKTGDVPPVAIDLTDRRLEQPRLEVSSADRTVLWVPAFTDLKLHDISKGPGDPNREPIDQLAPAGSEEFFAGNGRFLTRALWGAASQPPYFHNGRYTTMRETIEAHHGEAETVYQRWRGLSEIERDAVIEFLKTLRVLPAGTPYRIMDDVGRRRHWDSPLGDGG